MLFIQALKNIVNSTPAQPLFSMQVTQPAKDPRSDPIDLVEREERPLLDQRRVRIARRSQRGGILGEAGLVGWPELSVAPALQPTTKPLWMWHLSGPPPDSPLVPHQAVQFHQGSLSAR